MDYRMLGVASDIETPHEEYVHDIAYDFYGERVATCSSDLTIVISPVISENEFKEEEEDKKDQASWSKSEIIKAHEGPVWRVQWADPAFGTFIASGSNDRTIKVWEEKETSTTKLGIHKKWQHIFTHAWKECSDIKFAPKQLGFKIAACQKEGPGSLIVIEPKGGSRLQTTEPQAQIKVNNYGCNALSWDPDGTESSGMIVVGCNSIFSDYTVSSISKKHEYSKEEIEASTQNLMQVFALGNNKFTHILSLTAENGHEKGVRDVAWAPRNGRVYHTIASGAETTINIWRLDVLNKGLSAKCQITKSISENIDIIRGIKWNMIGTKVIAMTDDDISIYDRRA